MWNSVLNLEGIRTEFHISIQFIQIKITRVLMHSASVIMNCRRLIAVLSERESGGSSKNLS